jgi:hypothetical protein
MESYSSLQTDREQIRKQVELGEELLSRFKHWEPVIRKCQFPYGMATRF